MRWPFISSRHAHHVDAAGRVCRHARRRRPPPRERLLPRPRRAENDGVHVVRGHPNRAGRARLCLAPEHSVEKSAQVKARRRTTRKAPRDFVAPRPGLLVVIRTPPCIDSSDCDPRQAVRLTRRWLGMDGAQAGMTTSMRLQNSSTRMEWTCSWSSNSGSVILLRPRLIRLIDSP